MDKVSNIKDEKVKIKKYSSVGKNGVKITVSFSDNVDDDKNSREIIKDFIVREIL